MNWWTLGGSLVAILVLAAIALILKLGDEAPLASPEEAAAAAEAALAGFATANVVLGTDGTGALAIGEDGRLAVVKRHGARVAVRAVEWGDVRLGAGGAVIDTRERRFGAVTLAGVDALHLRRLAASQG